MPWIGRAVATVVPHHGTQRGDRRRTGFFVDADDRLYGPQLRANCRTASVVVRAWCLMRLVQRCHGSLIGLARQWRVAFIGRARRIAGC